MKCVINQALILAAAFSVAAAAPDLCVPNWIGSDDAACLYWHSALGLGTSYKCVQEPVTASQSRTPYACCTTGSTAPVINEFNNNCVVNSGSSTVTSILALAATAMLVIAMV